MLFTLSINMRFMLLSLLIGVSAGSDYYVTITNNGPVIVGANITFTADLFTSDGKRPTSNFKYKWKDNIQPQHHDDFIGTAQSNWTVTYSPDLYKPGSYQVEVQVFLNIFFDWQECSKRESFQLTGFLNGNMALEQNGTSPTSDYISNASEVKHVVELGEPDAKYIKSREIDTYWYIDCNYIGKTNDMTLTYNYTTSDKMHFIDALVVASFDSNHTSTVDSTTTYGIDAKTDSSTEIYSINSTSKTNDVKVNATKFSYSTVNYGTANDIITPDVQFDCATKNVSSTNDKRYVHGLFSRKIKVKAPVSNLKIEGNNWLQHGDILNLQVWCNGSSPFSYCERFLTGNYSINGSESCNSKKIYSSTCNFEIRRYLDNSSNYTVVVIVENDVQKVVRGVYVNVYEVTKHAQLSVIIVPVTAGIVAVILIIFGVAYYVQSRRRYIVEVADFDFSNASDMEYKTFHERLVEAVSNAFNKTEDYGEQDSTNGVPANKKYGSMQ